MRIGTFRSLSNPKKRYAIFRHGSTKANGGKGVKWVCSCAKDASSHDTFDSPCKHLRCLWAYAKHDSLTMLLNAGFITLTLDGQSFFEKNRSTVSALVQSL